MIELRSCRLRAAILPKGASLTGLWVQDAPQSLVLGSSEETAYDMLTYFGAVVGPVANRLSGAMVALDRQKWYLEANEGTTCLHSGAAGLHDRNWEVTHRTWDSITLRCVLEHGVGGLPGHRVIEARYDLKDTGCLRVTLSATTDRTTLMNLAHHPYWNLDGTPTIAAHRLQVEAARYLPVTAATLPTGQIASVTGTAYDFTSERPVPTDVTLDANLCLSRARRRIPHPAATLTGASGLRLRIDTTETGLQVYNGRGLATNAAPLHNGRILRPCAAIALEPQGWPDAPNHPDFPSIHLVPGERYEQVTEYHILS